MEKNIEINGKIYEFVVNSSCESTCRLCDYYKDCYNSNEKSKCAYYGYGWCRVYLKLII
ncbi:MAG: hypothetical protein LBC49_01005 [Bacteroidales bacterium]|jgi:hypothetical protein|nr:hypothetical protein [Bacteroidales bacterium]